MREREVLIARIKELLAVSRKSPDEAESKAALKEACALMWENYIAYDEVKDKGAGKKVKEDYQPGAEQSSCKTVARFKEKYPAERRAGEKKVAGGSACQSAEAMSESASGEKSVRHYAYNTFLGVGGFTMLVIFLLVGADEIFPGTIDRLPFAFVYFIVGSFVVVWICCALLLFWPDKD